MSRWASPGSHQESADPVSLGEGASKSWKNKQNHKQNHLSRHFSPINNFEGTRYWYANFSFLMPGFFELWLFPQPPPAKVHLLTGAPCRERCSSFGWLWQEMEQIEGQMGATPRESCVLVTWVFAPPSQSRHFGLEPSIGAWNRRGWICVWGAQGSCPSPLQTLEKNTEGDATVHFFVGLRVTKRLNLKGFVALKCYKHLFSNGCMGAIFRKLARSDHQTCDQSSSPTILLSYLLSGFRQDRPFGLRLREFMLSCYYPI